jgi:flavin reductase (DIM6/NTAB) family NADH-FMN oxidoreductase RutF
VINLPPSVQVAQVDRLALTTGRDPVPARKSEWGYRYEADKFGVAGFTPMASEVVAPPRVHECPVQMEGVVHDVRPFGKNVSANAFEVHIVRMHVDESLLVPGSDPERAHIDPLKWRPLIMSFCRFFDLGDEAHPSRLAESAFMKLASIGARQAAR